MKRIGSAAPGAPRSSDQTQAAKFWAEGPAVWTRAMRQLATGRGLRPADSARMYARDGARIGARVARYWNHHAFHHEGRH